ncbi:MAG: PaaI family thioesterase [Gammaproteobacteria bacterium]|jgi:uncharacterized protein (TIGR00369 family)|nr:PaaI family thioesterase [Gammaproteobacteria bacterium]MBT3859721.1 PaaI family thioesterase [Gammaproteobacteria bacterium]MBT3987242.1 PaaI family thioesterase [Gammaproteobacteria bacterium]MBT4257231.1 PaaI family thioesterase [Gammaproteobacteria bacterium]MBT4581566.1 PaaI family thioesterase [Gammaproteobacteria bacterium]
MTLKPEDFDIPPHYRHWVGDKAEDYIGPFFFHMDGDQPSSAFRVEDRHCNAHDSVHGGVLMTFADYTLCLCANGGETESVVTVSCNSEFVAPAFKDDLVHGKGEVIRRGGSMVFARCQLIANDQIILIASAVIKRIRKTNGT